MRIRFRILLALLLATLPWPQQGSAQQSRAGSTPAAQQPKLVVAIMIDQFRYDYLTRFRGEYKGGLKRMMEEGATFTNARYQQFPTVTAPGHATILTGAPPSASGIVANEWWDRETGSAVTSVSDPRTRLLGGEGAGSSPRRLMQPTVGDELRSSGKGGKIIGVSIKDRAAILPAGRTADAAYWFDRGSGNFVSSTYYFKTLPAWAEAFNKSRPADKYAGQKWLAHQLPPSPGEALYGRLDFTPFTNELLQQFALRALAAEKLGTGTKTDVLAISYSGNDTVGHTFGPDSEEAHDMALRVDQLIGDLLRAADAQAGTRNVLVVLCSDHGVAPVPEENAKRNMPGGRVDMRQVAGTLESALRAKFGGERWLAYASGENIYFNPRTLKSARVKAEDVENTAAAVLRGMPHVFRVYTRQQLMRGTSGGDETDAAVLRGFNEARSSDLVLLFEQYWITTQGRGTTHGSLFEYDTHVPLMFLGPGIKPGQYTRAAAPNDAAPTLAKLLGIGAPKGSAGRVLTEMLK